MPAWEFQRFRELLHAATPCALPGGPVDPAAELENVDASVRWTRQFLAQPASAEPEGRRRTKAGEGGEFS
jgi:hypothetical protein